MRNHVQLFATQWTVACQAPLPMGFSRQEYWSGLPCLSPADLPNPEIEPGSLALQADSLLSEPPVGSKKKTKKQLHDLLILIYHLGRLLSIRQLKREQYFFRKKNL